MASFVKYSVVHTAYQPNKPTFGRLAVSADD